MPDNGDPDNQIDDDEAARNFEDITASTVQRLIDIHGDDATIFAAIVADEAREADIDDPAYDFWMQIKRIIVAYQQVQESRQH